MYFRNPSSRQRLERIRFSIPLLFGTAFTLAGCQDLDQRSLSGLTVEPASERAGTAIIFLKERCPVNPIIGSEGPALAVIGVAASFVGDFAATAVQSFLERQREGLSGQFVAGGSQPDLYDEAGRLRFACMAIARGLFGQPGPKGASGDGQMSTATLGVLSMVDYPAFYLELAVQLQENALTLSPRYLRYAQSSAMNEGSGYKHVGVTVALSEASRTARNTDELKDGDHIALFNLNLGRLEIGKSYRHIDNNSPIFQGMSAVQKLPNEPKGEGSTPFNITAIVTEAEESGLVLDTLIKAVSANKESISDLIENAIRGAFVEEEVK